MQLTNIAEEPGIMPTYGVPFGERAEVGIVDLAATPRTGGPVRVIAGPLADRLALFEQLDAAGRARVALEMPCRQVRATTGRRNLMPAA